MKVTVKDVANASAVLAGRAGIGREIASPRMSTPDLSSPDSWPDIASSIVHLPPSQLAYLASIARAERVQVVRAILKRKPAGIVVSGGRIAAELLYQAESAKLALFRSRSLQKLARILAERLTPRVSLHGVLVQIFGLGTLIIGESAIGKSEAALDLVLRGHKLVADDVVILEKNDGGITGHATDLGADLLQIRGLGIIDIKALYGESATAGACRIGLVVELEEWKKGQHYSLVGLRERRYKLFAVNLPYLKLPVKTGRNIATLIEVAARNQMLKKRGVYTARELHRRLNKRLSG
ncbi:MAG: HPr(Ser) kinase/phosphatase [Nitrospirae bacterium GWC2_57_9]|nr:MAG: HPr(Ser) kinase/phosphatase [Nitrospirae bacterium GWC2_57_9]